MNQFQPMSASSYIPLLIFLQNKNAIINVKNYDDKCFIYAVLSALYPVQINQNRVSSYIQHSKKLNFHGISFPVELKQILQFEKQNPEISINIYTYNTQDVKINTLRLTKNVKKNHIHLLLLTDTKSNKSHYCWIKNLSRLLHNQVTRNKVKKYFCDRCLQPFVKLDKFKSHRVDCMIQNECEIEMSANDNNKMKFENFKNQLYMCHS